MRDERTVLVVDDDPTIVGLMRDFLEAEGFRVEGAENVHEAMAVLDHTPVDCILLDIMMPGRAASSSSGDSAARATCRSCSSARGARIWTRFAGLGLAATITSSSPPRPRRWWRA